MAAPSSAEARLLTEFAKRFKVGELNENQVSDQFLIRWIRARNHNLDKAEEMLRKSLQWRQENDMDNASSWQPPDNLKVQDPIGVVGFDSDNCPVIVNDFGRMNFRKIVRSGQQDAYMKYIHCVFEQALEQMNGREQSDGTRVTQCVLISDMKGFSYKSLASKGVVDLVLQSARSIEANHPEVLKKLYVINAGSIFSVLMALVKPVLAPGTQAKLSVYNSPSKWKPVLLQNIPADVLPPTYGGTNTIAESYREDDEPDTEGSENEFLVITILPRDQLKIICEVEEKGCKISWAFKTNKTQIGFALHSAPNDNPKVYFEHTQVDSHLKLIEGSITCDKIGEYVVIFDNGNNEAQELQCRIDVRSASGAKQLTFD